MSVGLWVCVVGGCEDDAPAGQSIQKAPREAARVAAPKPPVRPPEVRLQVLEERLAVGLSIQNRGRAPQRFAARLRLLGGDKVRELPLVEGAECITLRPGGEWLWPSDWGQTLAPDQSALASLVGTFRFEVRACEGEGAVASEPFALPARYGEGASAPGR